MYIASDYLNRMINSEQVGVWVESAGSDFALIAKLPSNVAKAVSMGAKLELLVGITNEKCSSYVIALKVFDSIDNPFLVVMPQRWRNSDNILNSGYFNKDITLTIYDEVDGIVIGAIIELSLPDNKQIFTTMLSSSLLPVDSLKSANDLYDAFCYQANLSKNIFNGIDMDIFTVDVNVKEVKSLLNIKVTEVGSNYYEFGSEADGGIQETQLHHVLRLMFGNQAYHSPQVTIGNKTRELTDIFALAENYYICIESKCISINQAALNRKSDRIVSVVVKSCSKAIKQLEGTLKAIKRNEVIKTDNNELITFNRSNPGHLIVLISEYLESSKWDALINPVKSILHEHEAMVHILSLSEFSYLLKLSQSNAIILDAILIERYEAFYDNNTFNILSMNSSLPCD